MKLNFRMLATCTDGRSKAVERIFEGDWAIVPRIGDTIFSPDPKDRWIGSDPQTVEDVALHPDGTVEVWLEMYGHDDPTSFEEFLAIAEDRYGWTLLPEEYVRDLYREPCATT